MMRSPSDKQGVQVSMTFGRVTNAGTEILSRQTWATRVDIAGACTNPLSLCPACVRAAIAFSGGTYNLACLGCCVRLVKNRRPLRNLQDAALAHIERQRLRDNRPSPTREEVLAELKKQKENHENLARKATATQP
jgi:hypothetical protein